MKIENRLGIRNKNPDLMEIQPRINHNQIHRDLMSQGLLNQSDWLMEKFPTYIAYLWNFLGEKNEWLAICSYPGFLP